MYRNLTRLYIIIAVATVQGCTHIENRQSTNGASFLLHSMNDPNHFVAYEEWPEKENLDVGNFWISHREELEGSLRGLDRIESKIEIFEVFHDPGKNPAGQPAATDRD